MWIRNIPRWIFTLLEIVCCTPPCHPLSFFVKKRRIIAGSLWPIAQTPPGDNAPSLVRRDRPHHLCFGTLERESIAYFIYTRRHLAGVIKKTRTFLSAGVSTWGTYITFYNPNFFQENCTQRARVSLHLTFLQLYCTRFVRYFNRWKSLIFKAIWIN